MRNKPTNEIEREKTCHGGYQLELERTVAFQAYLLENIQKVLNDEDVSDFALSFSVIREVKDLVNMLNNQQQRT